MNEQEAAELLNSGRDVMHFLINANDPLNTAYWIRISNTWYLKDPFKHKHIRSTEMGISEYSRLWKFRALTSKESQQYILDITLSLLTDA